MNVLTSNDTVALFSLLLVLLIILVGLLYLFVRFITFNQNSANVFIRDDTRSACLYDVLSGNAGDNDTKYFGVMASLSEHVYSDLSNREIDSDWVKVLSKNGTALDSDKNYSGLHFTVWKNDKEKMAALVFRGTDKPDDMHANFHWITKHFPFYKSQYEQVPEVLKEVEPLLPAGYRIVSAGHSLGGGLAQLALYSSTRIKTAYVYNTTSVTGWSDLGIEYKDRHKDLRVKNTKIYRINEYGDALQFLRYLTNLGHMLSPEPNIHPYIVEYRLNTQNGNAIKQHSIARISKALNHVLPCQSD